MTALLFALVALGEMAVGALVAVVPAFASFLIGAPIEGTGLVAVRMMGVAVLVIGLSWWLARAEPAGRARLLPGFLVYNFGIGALFAWAATSASQPVVPWILAAIHVASGAACAAAEAASPREPAR